MTHNEDLFRLYMTNLQPLGGRRKIDAIISLFKRLLGVKCEQVWYKEDTKSLFRR